MAAIHCYFSARDPCSCTRLVSRDFSFYPSLMAQSCTYVQRQHFVLTKLEEQMLPAYLARIALLELKIALLHRKMSLRRQGRNFDPVKIGINLPWSSGWQKYANLVFTLAGEGAKNSEAAGLDGKWENRDTRGRIRGDTKCLRRRLSPKKIKNNFSFI